MEIVLQWFDELDDLAFTGMPVWRALRRICLILAFVAAVSLHALPLLGLDAARLLALHDTALVALALWTVFAAVTVSAERSLAAHTQSA